MPKNNIIRNEIYENNSLQMIRENKGKYTVTSKYIQKEDKTTFET